MLKARFLLPNHKPPGRMYVNLLGLERVFGNGKGIEKALDNAIDYGTSTLAYNKRGLSDFDFFIGIISSDTVKMERVFTLFAYYDVYKQHTAPKIGRQFFRGRYLLSEKIEHLDEDTITLLYKENEFRKTTESLEDYMNRYPHLGKLEPKRGFGELLV
ncbi:hypothetical protein HYV89_02220 [Candidatus Woesearchaeota archaeon]|nr:hypothetical protein [Candidatus Woesearchaeota archaeon]